MPDRFYPFYLKIKKLLDIKEIKDSLQITANPTPGSTSKLHPCFWSHSLNKNSLKTIFQLQTTSDNPSADLSRQELTPQKSFWWVLRARGAFTAGSLIQHQNHLLLLLTGFPVKLHRMFQNQRFIRARLIVMSWVRGSHGDHFVHQWKWLIGLSLPNLTGVTVPHEGVKDLTPEIQGTLKDPCQNSRDCGGLSCFIPKSDVVSLTSQEVLEPGVIVLELKKLTQKFFRVNLVC